MTLQRPVPNGALEPGEFEPAPAARFPGGIDAAAAVAEPVPSPPNPERETAAYLRRAHRVGAAVTARRAIAGGVFPGPPEDGAGAAALPDSKPSHSPDAGDPGSPEPGEPADSRSTETMPTAVAAARRPRQIGRASMIAAVALAPLAILLPTATFVEGDQRPVSAPVVAAIAPPPDAPSDASAPLSSGAAEPAAGTVAASPAAAIAPSAISRAAVAAAAETTWEAAPMLPVVQPGSPDSVPEPSRQAAPDAEISARLEAPPLPPPPAAQAAIVPPGRADPLAEAALLLSRGDALFGTGDVASARLYYECAAAIGDATAALRLGESYDPAFLERAGLSRVRGDAGVAAFWYRKARDLGSGEAEILLQSFDAK